MNTTNYPPAPFACTLPIHKGKCPTLNRLPKLLNPQPSGPFRGSVESSYHPSNPGVKYTYPTASYMELGQRLNVPPNLVKAVLDKYSITYLLVPHPAMAEAA